MDEPSTHNSLSGFYLKGHLVITQKKNTLEVSNSKTMNFLKISPINVLVDQIASILSFLINVKMPWKRE
jgi:hypothetical protein